MMIVIAPCRFVRDGNGLFAIIPAGNQSFVSLPIYPTKSLFVAAKSRMPMLVDMELRFFPDDEGGVYLWRVRSHDVLPGDAEVLIAP